MFALTFVKTIEWSLPKNSLVTVKVQRETHELDTRTKSNRFHAFRPVSKKCVGAVVFRKLNRVRREPLPKTCHYSLCTRFPTSRGER